MTIIEIHREATRAMGYQPTWKRNDYAICEGCEERKLYEEDRKPPHGVDFGGDWYCDDCVESEEKIFRCRACGKWREKRGSDNDEVAAKCCDSICMAERIVAMEAAMEEAAITVKYSGGNSIQLKIAHQMLEKGLKGKQ